MWARTGNGIRERPQIKTEKKIFVSLRGTLENCTTTVCKSMERKEETEAHAFQVVGVFAIIYVPILMIPLPSSVLDLKDWYVTLPTGKPGHPDTVMQPPLAQYSDEYFKVNATGDAVVFTGPCDGVTTINSHYPRSELREMSGLNRAAWSIASGSHEMRWEGSVVHLPEKKSETVIGQIHDAKEDIVMVKCTGKQIVFMSGGKTVHVLDGDYKLGKRYILKIKASKGVITVYYNDMVKPAFSVPAKSTKCDNYFKAGCYTQSNATKGDGKGQYAQVQIFKLAVMHKK